jgi:hypothetical protein
MPPLEDAELLKSLKAILSNWNVTDYVTAKGEALDWAGKNLPGFTLKLLAKLMHEHVAAGGRSIKFARRVPNGTIGLFITITVCRGLIGRSTSKPFSSMMTRRIPTFAS